MNCKLKLASRMNSFEICLQSECLGINEQLDKELVYQNQAYETTLIIEDNSEEIKQIRLFINNELINNRFNKEFKCIDSGIYKLSEEFIFSTIFGFANISIEIECVENTEYFYSEYISVAVDKNNEESLMAINKMIEYIYNLNSELLYSSTIDRVSKIQSSTEYSENRGMDTEIALLNEIIKTYSANLKFFMSDLKYKLSSYNEIDSLKKLRKFDNNTIKFIVQHPEELIPVKYFTGISYNYNNYEPVKTLISKNCRCYDIYENKVILGFLKYLLNETKAKIDKINRMLKESQVNLSLRFVLEENYILSSEIVYKYSRIIMIKYVQNLNNISEKLHELYFSYKSILKIEGIMLNNSPKPTNIFISIVHYRNIFISINKWFKHGNYDMTNNKDILAFLTADEIYEYYCLLNIIQLIKKNDFIEDEVNRKCYHYNVPNDLYNNTKVPNTFSFHKNNKVLTLYYQPVIYSYENETRNNITLFRTDSKKNYFTPDFIIKIDNGDNNIKYAIIDSKWSKYETIKRYRFNEAVIKYLFSTKNQENLENVSLMWLLQGKEEYNKKNIFYYNNSEISRSFDDSFRNVSGIIKLTPSTGTKYLSQILGDIL